MATEVTIYETVNNVTVYEDVTDVSISEDVINVTVDQTTETTTVTISNEQGLQGPTGPTGPAGPAGPAGPLNPYSVVTNPTATQTIVNSASGVVPLAINQSGQAHTLTARLSATSGSDITALNVVSSNPNSSAMWVSGKEYGHGTLKVAHLQPESGSDANAAAVSINLASDVTRGPAGDATETQGIYMDTYQVANNSIKYPTSGNLLNLKNAGVQKLVLNPDGQLQLPQTTATGGITIGGDTELFRAASKVLRSNSALYLNNTTSDSVTFFTSVTSGLGSSVAPFAIKNTGKCEWGASGSTRDTFLYRSTTNTLKTDGTFIAALIDGGSA